MLRLPWWRRWWWHNNNRYRYPINRICVLLYTSQGIRGYAHMNTHVHTHIILCIYRETHMRILVHKVWTIDDVMWRRVMRVENIANNKKTFKFFSVQATLLHEFDCSRFKIHCCCQFYTLLCYFLLIWTYVVRSLGGIREDLKMKKKLFR